MCRVIPFSARALEENIFFDVDKKKHKNVKIEKWFIVVCTLIDNEYASLLFSQTFLSYCFCILSDFAKVFERKVWRVQVAHLHNAARVLSSLSRCFQCQTNLGKDFFRYLWYCDIKKTNQMSSSVELVKFHLFCMFLINLNAEIVACILSFRKSRHKPNL